jgi:hypothetical protein
MRTFTTRWLSAKPEGPVSILRNETLWNIQPAMPGSLCLDARELHHLAPLLGFFGDELSKFAR